MSDVYLIEVDGKAVGLVSRDGETSYRFHAAMPKMNAMDGQSFATPDLAQREARRLIQGAQPLAPHPRRAA